MRGYERPNDSPRRECTLLYQRIGIAAQGIPIERTDSIRQAEAVLDKVCRLYVAGDASEVDLHRAVGTVETAYLAEISRRQRAAAAPSSGKGIVLP